MELIGEMINVETAETFMSRCDLATSFHVHYVFNVMQILECKWPAVTLNDPASELGGTGVFRHK